MKLLVLGAGGIGGYFGGRLVDAGADVTFLVRPKRRDQIQRNGLRVVSQVGDLQLPVKTALTSELSPGYDIVLLTCKAYDLDSAMDAIVPVMDGKCAILPLLNGMAHFDRIDARFGSKNVMGGTCQISAALEKDGTIQHIGKLQRLTFGERDHAKSPRAGALAQAFANTTIDWEVSENIQQNLWEKLVFLSALAATTCLFRANISEIIAAPGGREIMERALDANIAIATKEGYPPRATPMEFARKGLTNPAGDWSASMLRDLEACGQVESDHIVGWMLDKARKHGIDDTVLSIAFTHLKAYEARRAAKRLPGS